MRNSICLYEFDVIATQPHWRAHFNLKRLLCKIYANQKSITILNNEIFIVYIIIIGNRMGPRVKLMINFTNSVVKVLGLGHNRERNYFRRPSRER
jgi:hypothetical protein